MLCEGPALLTVPQMKAKIGYVVFYKNEERREEIGLVDVQSGVGEGGGSVGPC